MPGNIMTIPLEQFSKWPPPNYDDPVTRDWMPIYAGILQGFMTVMLALRLWLRFQNRAGALGLDDLFLIPAFLGAVTWTALVIICCVHYGTDRHTWDVPPDEFENSLFLGAFLSEIAFLISTCCTKVSILLFYRRLTQGTYSKKWKWATIAAIVFTVVFCVAFLLVLCLQCRPTEAYWKSLSFTYTQDFQCSNTKILNPISGALSVVSDFYSVALPMMMTRHFDIDRRKKIALNAVFSLGLLVVAAGAVRTYYLTKLGYDYDITWYGFDVFIWATLELQLAIMCACAPALRVLFRHYLRDPLSRAVQTASSKTRSGNRSQQRDSKHLEPNENVDLKGSGDKKLVTHSTVSERDVGSFSTSTSPGEPKVVKTPADYEAYALQSLERYRADSYNRAPTRYNDDYIMQPRADAAPPEYHATTSPYQPQYHASTTDQYTQYRPTNAPYHNQYERPNAPYSSQGGSIHALGSRKSSFTSISNHKPQVPYEGG